MNGGTLLMRMADDSVEQVEAYDRQANQTHAQDAAW